MYFYLMESCKDLDYFTFYVIVLCNSYFIFYCIQFLYHLFYIFLPIYNLYKYINCVFLVDCGQSVFVRENPTSDKKSRKYANEGKERGENKAPLAARRSLCASIASDFIIP